MSKRIRLTAFCCLIRMVCPISRNHVKQISPLLFSLLERYLTRVLNPASSSVLFLHSVGLRVHKMIKPALTRGLFSLCISLFLIGCDYNASGIEEKDAKRFYKIEMGDSIFQIPTWYLVDKRNRIDGPQQAIISFAKIPSLEPIENAEKYSRPPDQTSNMVSFLITYTNLGKPAAYNLLYRWSKEKQVSTVSLPKKFISNGLIKLGNYKIGGTLNSDIYAYVKNGKAISAIRCDAPKDFANPHCTSYQDYHGQIAITVYFSIDHLDWYAKYGFIEIEKKIDQWLVT